MRVLLASLLLAATSNVSSETVDLFGFAEVSAGSAEGESSWIEGGFGRLTHGGDGPGDRDAFARGELQLGMIYEPRPGLRGVAHLVGRAHSADRGRAVGVTEAYLDYVRALESPTQISVRIGQFFHLSSMENVDDLWASPYTLTNSAINSWMGEEFRPIGVELGWQRFLPGGDRLSATVTVFGGNDTAGTLLAWRGFALHNRLSVFGEVVALPPLFSLEDPALFGGKQRADGTRPFGRDLDGRPGWIGQLGWQRTGQLDLRFSYSDNRGDRERHGNEYAWRTRFGLAGAKWQPTPATVLAFEWLEGTTAMAFPGMPWVEADFRAWYLLAALNHGRGWWAVRHDRFRTDERDNHPLAEINDESGHAWTLAWNLDMREDWRLAVEYLRVSGHRVAVTQSGADGDLGGDLITIALRRYF